MNRFPSLPTSAAIITDGTDVFLSFHFECETVADVVSLERPLHFWLKLFLEQQGIVAVELDRENLNG